MKNFFILVIIIIILFVIFKCSKNIMENFNDNPRILIMVISKNNINNNNSRWNIEKNNLLTNFKPKNNINLELMECGKVKETFVQNYQCNESFRPGIFQKTILSLKSNIDKYDYFVRTNLSTFIIQSRLQSYLKNINNKDVYDGVNCHDNWIAGWGIILNKNTSKLLLKDGIKNESFNSGKADDVLIGHIMRNNSIKCYNNTNNTNNNHLGYFWKYNLSFEENIKLINNKKNAIFIRLTHRGLEKDSYKKKQYLDTVNKLYKIYG